MSRVSIGIVSVPARYKMGLDLQTRLNDNSRVTLVCDARYQGSWYGTKLAWNAIAPGATHQIAMEEDVAVCKDFIATAEQIADLLPEALISFYSLKSDKSKVETAVKRNSHWYQQNDMPSGQAVMMPTKWVTWFLRWSYQWLDQKTVIHEDEHLWGWMQANHIPVWITVPNIVDHLGATISALGFNNANKTSPLYIGDNVSGLSIDWSQGLTTCRHYPKVRNVKRTLEGFKGEIRER